MEHGESEPLEHTIDWRAYRLLSTQPHGFGEDRVHIWPLLAHVGLLAEDKREALDSSVWSDIITDEGATEQDATPDGEPHADERQIELDTDRSFVLYPHVNNREKLQASLNRLIVSVFRRRPRLHYFQGYHDIVSVIFLTLPRELHIPVTEKLSLERLRDSMGTNLDPVVGLLRILQRLLRLADPTFAAVLDRAAPLPYFALSNLLTLFSHDVPTLPLIQHIFDYLLCRPPIAVVYLAAALILTRRQEVQVLEDEGEEGMMHSLLTVMPDLYEDGEGEEPTVDSKAQEHWEPAATISVKTEDVLPKEEDPRSTVQSEEDLPQDIAQETQAASPTDDDTVLVDATPLPPTDDEDSSDTIDDADTALPESTTTSPSLAEPTLGLEVKTEPPEHPLPTDSDLAAAPAPEPAEDEKPTPPSPSRHSPEPRPHRPRVSMTALLQHADELLARYPPSHPAIALDAVMGPQSVMRTWAERAADLPSDDEAERMGLRPELVVLPYVEDEDADESGEGTGEKGKRRREKEREERERRRRKLRKPRRLTDLVVQRKTMVAGAVLVLGVAMAVYGLNGGLPGAGNGHGRGGFGKEWRKMGRLLGGVVGVGGRVLDGIWRGLE